MPELHFESHLEADQGACFIRVPPETLTALGQRKRAPVKVTINGYVYRTTIAVYGGKSYLGVRREVREAAGVKAGDPLTVGLEYDAPAAHGGPAGRGAGSAESGSLGCPEVRCAFVHPQEGARRLGDVGETR